MFSAIKQFFTRHIPAAAPPVADWTPDQVEGNYLKALLVLQRNDPNSPHLQTELAKAALAKANLNKPALSSIPLSHAASTTATPITAAPITTAPAMAQKPLPGKLGEAARKHKVGPFKTEPAPALIPDDAFTLEHEVLPENVLGQGVALNHEDATLADDPELSSAFRTLSLAIEQGMAQVSEQVEMTPLVSEAHAEDEVFSGEAPAPVESDLDIPPEPVVNIPLFADDGPEPVDMGESEYESEYE